jgi:malate dehydrogenase
VRSVNILGAGELGATLAHRLALSERFRRIALVDPDVGKARGKALDMAQCGPIEHFDVSIEAHESLEAAPAADCLVIGDPPELAGPGGAKRAADLARVVAAAVDRGPVVVAPAELGPALVEAAARSLDRNRVVGSAPVAFAAATRRRLASQLGLAVDAIAAVPMGLPPAHAFVPYGSATLAGVPLEKLQPLSTRPALESMRSRVLGPVSLAHAASRVLEALWGARPSTLPVFAVLQGEYGQRGVALAVPARLCGGRIEAIVEFELEPVDRVAIDTAAEQRRRAVERE